MTTWNSYHEDLLQKWSAMSKTYSIMHCVSSEYYNTWDKRLGIPVILLGAVASSSIFTTQNESNKIWTFVNGGMVLLMTGISGISKFLGINEKLSKHTSASFKYTQISMDIDTVLSFPRKERSENPREFINGIKTSILEIREHAPDLPTWVLSSYIDKLDKSLINIDTKINTGSEDENSENETKLEEIDLIKRPSPKKQNSLNAIYIDAELHKPSNDKIKLCSISNRLENCSNL